MKLTKVLALILSASMMLTSFAACTAEPAESSTDESSTSSATESSETTESSEESSEPTATATGLYPGTAGADSIVVNLGSEPTSLNSLLATYTHDFDAMRHMYEGLVTLDADNNVVPGVAESWELSEDGLTITFKLREDAKWTNGDSVTAHDFVFAWSQLINPEVASEYAYFAFIMKNAEAYYNGEITDISEVGFVATSDYELVVTLENPTAYSLFTFSFGSFHPVNQAFYEEVGADNYALEPEYTLTNGAFMMDSWTHDSEIVMKKNPDWHRADEVTLETIKFVMISDTTAALNAFRAGELDVVGLSGDQVTLIEQEGQPITQYADGAEFHILFNHDNEYISNLNLRLALHYGFDRQTYIDTVYGTNSGTPATSFTSPDVNGVDGKFVDALEAEYGVLIPPTGDVALANQYLDTALTELGMTKEELGPEIIMNIGDSDTAQKHGAYMLEQYRVNLGLEIALNPMQTKAQSEARAAGNFVLDFTGWGPDYNDPNTFLDMWVTGGGNNSGNYSNPDYDALIEAAKTEVDPVVREGYFLEAEKMVMDEVIVSPTYWRVRNYTVSDKITGGYWRTTFSDLNYIFTTIAAE